MPWRSPCPRTTGGTAPTDNLTCVADRSRALPAFLAYYFKTPDGVRSLSEASPSSSDLNRTLNMDRLRSIRVPLPPLAEQQRIVALIEDLRGKIGAAQHLRRGTTEQLARLSSASRRRFFGDQPKSGWIPLSTHLARIESGKSPATEGRPANADEWAVLKVGAVSSGVFDERENKALPPSYSVDPTLEVRPGDVLMCRSNTPELVGSCALVTGTRPRLVLSDKTFRLIFRDPKGMVPTYFDHVMKSAALRNQIMSVASGTSPTMKNISKQKVLELLVPPHSPRNQRAIASSLEGVRAKIEAVQRLQSQTAAELDALMPAILDRAFRGEL